MGRFFPLPAMYVGDGYKSATRTVPQLVQWFGGQTRKALHKEGYVLRVYEVHEVAREDDYQVAVHLRKYLRPVVTHSLLDVQNSA